jgi:hypothetical protein
MSTVLSFRRSAVTFAPTELVAIAAATSTTAASTTPVWGQAVMYGTPNTTFTVFDSEDSEKRSANATRQAPVW